MQSAHRAAQLRGDGVRCSAARGAIVRRQPAPPVAAPSRGGASGVRTCALELPDATTIAYWSIGASAVSFVGTFGLAPLFRKQFKEDLDWQTIYAELLESGGVPSVTPQQAYSRRKSVPLVDVRLDSKYEKAHPQGARSLPLYVPIQGWGPAATIRRVGFAFFGIYGTQLNTSFEQQAGSLIPKGKEVAVVCEMGGSLGNKSGTKFGFQSRSLKAAYYLRRAGYRVSYVQGGIAQWASEGLPLEEGPDDGQPITSSGDEDGGAAGSRKGFLSGLKLPSLVRR